MQIQRDSWHFRAYEWFEREKGRCVVSRTIDYVKYYKPINLCPYFRIVFLWAPLRWWYLSGSKGKIATAWGLLWLQVLTFLYWTQWAIVDNDEQLFLYMLFLMTTAVLIAAGTLMVCVGAIIALFKRVGIKAPQAIVDASDLVKEYAHAAHSKICPILDVKE